MKTSAKSSSKRARGSDKILLSQARTPASSAPTMPAGGPNLPTGKGRPPRGTLQDPQLEGGAHVPIRVSVIALDEAARGRLVALIGGTTRLRVVSSDSDFKAALRDLPRVQPRVAVIDADLLATARPDCMSRVNALLPSLRVLAVGTSSDKKSVLMAL